MKKKLSQKERNESVTKGFLEDYKDFLERKKYVTESSLKKTLENKDYVTKDFLKKQDYVTKDWATEMYQKITEEFARHTNALVEMIRHENRLIIEALEHRIERIENYIGLPYPRS